MKQIKTNNLNIAGLLLFLAGVVLFMGIITAEIFYPPGFSTRNSSISGLGATKPPNSIVVQPSSTIFNVAMIIGGIMIMIASYLLYRGFKKKIITISLFLVGCGLCGLGIFSCIFFTVHYASAVIVFISVAFFITSLYTVTDSSLRYFFLIFGIISLILDFSGQTFIEILGKGGQERYAIYPLLFSLVGFGGYLSGKVRK